MPHKPQPPKQPSGPLELRVGDMLIHYHVVRSIRRKKTIEISLDPVKGVRVAAPIRTSDARIEEVVRSRAAWIAHTTRDMAARPLPRRYMDGETLLYQGRTLLLRVLPVTGSQARVALQESGLEVAVPEAALDVPASTQIAVLTWYRRRALERLTAAVQHWSRIMGLQASQILVRDQKTLWGSCAADGTLRFNWRVIQVTPYLMDYIVVHELAHIKMRSHSPRFWKEVARYLPDHLVRRRTLRQAGRALGM